VWEVVSVEERERDEISTLRLRRKTIVDSIADVLLWIAALLLIFGIPAVPGIVVWNFLAPETFWEKFGTLVLGVVLYMIVFAVIVAALHSQD